MKFLLRQSHSVSHWQSEPKRELAERTVPILDGEAQHMYEQISGPGNAAAVSVDAMRRAFAHVAIDD